MLISLIQTNIIDGNPLGNANAITKLIQEDKNKTDLYLLPEVWTTGYARECWPEYTSTQHDKILTQLCRLAQERKIWIGGSYVAAASNTQYANRFLLIDSDGNIAASYDKAHLFSPLGEDQRFKAGQELVQLNIGPWQTNLSICYDLRFPNMYRRAAVEGTTLFLIVAQWPAERCEHMVALAQARAIENQAYVALCNRIGPTQSGLHFGGMSGIWGPDGTALISAQTQTGIFGAHIDLQNVIKARTKLPVLSDLNPKLDL